MWHWYQDVSACTSHIKNFEVKDWNFFCCLLDFGVIFFSFFFYIYCGYIWLISGNLSFNSDCICVLNKLTLETSTKITRIERKRIKKLIQCMWLWNGSLSVVGRGTLERGVAACANRPLEALLPSSHQYCWSLHPIWHCNHHPGKKKKN